MEKANRIFEKQDDKSVLQVSEADPHPKYGTLSGGLVEAVEWCSTHLTLRLAKPRNTAT